MANPTTNFGWTLPVVGGSQDGWGTILNAMAQDIDDDLQDVDTIADGAVTDAAAAQATADAALPKAGGILTGRVENNVASVLFSDEGSVSGTLSLDISTANVFKFTMTGNITTLTLANVPSITGDYAQVILLDVTDGGYSISWPAAVTEWAGGSAPTLDGHQLIALISFDDGTSWQGSIVQKNLS